MTTPSLAALGALTLLAGPRPPAPSIPFETYRLANGLNVILSEDHSAPVVGIDLTYNVGSRDEKPGRTGFAHLFEHLRFEGSQHLSSAEASRLIEGAGGNSNGSTDPDRTRYWEQVPSNALERMLYMEADKMGFLLPTLDQSKLDNQREVVLNERRQNYEMRPYGLAWITLNENLWDPAFPYHWPPIGSPRDLQAATLADVREFFVRHYAPVNASLAIAGDIDPVRTRELVEKWFGSIPAGPASPHAYPQPNPLQSEKRVRLEDQVQLPRTYLAWQSPKSYAEDDAALAILGEILSTGKSARLNRRLVMDEQIAQSVSAWQHGQALAGTFMIVATAKPGVALQRLEREIDEEIARIAREPPSALELARVHNRIESLMIFGLEPVSGSNGRAATLNDYYWDTGNPGYFAQDLDRYLSVTAEQVRAAAARWLGPNRVVMEVVPRSGSTPPPSPAGQKAGEEELE